MAHRPAKHLRILFSTVAAALVAGAAATDAFALKIDQEGNINLNVRAYVNARIGTMAKQSTRPGEQPPECAANPNADNCNFGGTYPYSGAGHLIQNRYFLEMKWNHDLMDMFHDILPSNVTAFKYNLTYRGEYDGIYDYGPNEYSHASESQQEIEQVLRQGGFSTASAASTTYAKRHRLRNVASNRNRLFQAFVDWEQGPVFVRFGRQTIAWGETDVFRLLDNINPIDNSFGGFFLDLDERRVPLNMLRASLNLGEVGPLEQAFIEGYFAVDRTVAYDPGAPAGSPWAPPLGAPVGTTLTVLKANGNGFDRPRGGGRFVFNYGDFTFTLASYATVFDTQAVHFQGAKPTDNGYVPGVSVITAVQTPPHIWVNGASMTTALPSLKSVLRTEFAYFDREALFRGPTETAFPDKGLTTKYITDFLGPVTSGQFNTVSRKNTLNFSVGWDTNQYIRFLNPSQTFFISTQFFARAILRHDNLQAVPVPEPNNSTRVVPLPSATFLHTFAINTTYNVAVPATNTTLQVTPGMNMFYDWQGMFLFQPGVRFARDPWRFIVDYQTINSGVFRYQIGLVRDRSNVRAQIEYVL